MRARLLGHRVKVRDKITVQFSFVSLLCVARYLQLNIIYAHWVGASNLWEQRQTVWLDLRPAKVIMTASSQLSLKENQHFWWHHSLSIWPASWIFWFKIGVAFCHDSLLGIPSPPLPQPSQYSLVQYIQNVDLVMQKYSWDTLVSTLQTCLYLEVMDWACLFLSTASSTEGEYRTYSLSEPAGLV